MVPARVLLCMAAALTGSVVECFSSPAPLRIRAERSVQRRSPVQPMTTVAARASPISLSEPKSSLPFFLDPGTKGGISFWTIVAIVLPFFGYNFMTDVLNYDVVLAGQVILVGYVGLGTLVWTGRCVSRRARATSSVSASEPHSQPQGPLVRPHSPLGVRASSQLRLPRRD
jgi:hypothetical protein